MKFLALDIFSFGPLRYGPVNLPLDKQGLVLVEGNNLDAKGSADSNGAGKSMLFEAIPWALWGKMPRYGDRPVGSDACHPTHGADVSVEFELNGEVFRVHRVKPVNGSVKVRIYVRQFDDWSPLEGSALHALEADLSTLLGFTYDTFRSALFLQAAGFTVTTGGFAAQMKLLENVLRFDVLAKAGDRAKVRGTEALATLTATENRLDSLQREIESHDHEIATLDALDESAREKQLRVEIDALEAKRRTIRDVRLADARMEYENAVVVHSTARANSQVSHTAYGRIKGLEGKPECPTCSAPLKNVAAMLKAAGEDYHKALSIQENAQTVMEAARRTVEKAEATQTEQQSIMTQVSSNRAELNSLLARKVTLKDQYDRVRRLRAAKYDESDEIKKAVAKQRWDLSIASFWSTAFASGDGLKAEILGSAAPVLNAAASRYSELLTDGNIRVEFNALRGKKTEDLIRLSGEGSPKYDGLSSGEKRRVDIIVALSLRALARWRLARPVNVGLMDEVFDTLDEAGLNRVSSVVQQDMEELSSLFVVTHNPALKAMFPGAKVWRVTRKGGTAKVSV